jgi:hypothetical protein
MSAITGAVQRTGVDVLFNRYATGRFGADWAHLTAKRLVKGP